MTSFLRAVVALCMVSLVAGRRQPQQDAFGAAFAVPDVLAMASPEDVKVAAQLDRDVTRLRGRQSLGDAPHDDAPPSVAMTVHAGQNDPIKEFGDELHHIGQEHVAKPFMDGIHVFRMMMCWERPELLAHKKCMNYMVHHCAKERSGKGYCEKLVNMLTRKCDDGDERAVAYARKLELQCTALDEGKTKAAMEELDASAGNDEDPNEDLIDLPGPAPAPAASPGPAPPAPGPAPMITDLDKVLRPLPNQGFNEYSYGDDGMVKHEDMKTHTADWRMEWPDYHETEDESVERICKDKPDLDWCQLFLKDRLKTHEFAKSFNPLDHKDHERLHEQSPSHEEVHEHIESADEDAHEAVFDRRPKHDEAFA